MLGGAVGPSLFGALIEMAGLQAAFLGIAAVTAVALVLAIGVVVTYDDYAAATVERLRA
jgi:fucose permease